MIKSCPYCGSNKGFIQISRNESTEIKGKSISYMAIHYECNECHGIFDTPEQMNANLCSARKNLES